MLADLVLSWGLLENGGIMIPDDYRWDRNWHFNLRPAFEIDKAIKQRKDFQQRNEKSKLVP